MPSCLKTEWHILNALIISYLLISKIVSSLVILKIFIILSLTLSSFRLPSEDLTLLRILIRTPKPALLIEFNLPKLRAICLLPDFSSLSMDCFKSWLFARPTESSSISKTLYSLLSIIILDVLSFFLADNFILPIDCNGTCYEYGRIRSGYYTDRKCECKSS